MVSARPTGRASSVHARFQCSSDCVQGLKAPSWLQATDGMNRRGSGAEKAGLKARPPAPAFKPITPQVTAKIQLYQQLLGLCRHAKVPHGHTCLTFMAASSWINVTSRSNRVTQVQRDRVQHMRCCSSTSSSNNGASSRCAGDTLPCSASLSAMSLMEPSPELLCKPLTAVMAA